MVSWSVIRSMGQSVSQSIGHTTNYYLCFYVGNHGRTISCFCLSATWNQFDGVAYVYGDKSMFSRVMGYFSKDKTVEYRTKALLCFLPKWRGFIANEAAEEMDATKALVKLENVVHCLSNVWIEESRCHRQRQPMNFDVRKVNCQVVIC